MSDYFFSTHADEPEYQRLCLIQKAFDEKSQKHLLKAGIQKGMSCLEVGVGAGSMAAWMKEEVGIEGYVLGIDLSTRLLDMQEVAYDLREGDLLEAEIETTFDLIHLRYVLIHNKTASIMLEKLFSLLKPGGKIVIEEPDFTLAKWIDAQNIDALKRVNDAIVKIFDAKGLKARYGSIMHLTLQETGFTLEDQQSYLHLNSGKDDMALAMGLSAKALIKEYVQTGVCDEQDVEAYIQACEDEDSLGVYYATIAVTAMKPAVTNDIPSKRLSEGISEAKEVDEIRACFEVMHQLRLNLDPVSFETQVQAQRQEGYHLFYKANTDRVVAVAGCRIGRNLAWGKHLYIDDLVTLEEERSAAHGQELLNHLKAFARAEGCGQIHLDSGVQRFAAHKFYLREGFVIASHHFSYKVEM